MNVVIGAVRRLRIGKRLLAAFGLIVALIVVITVVGVIGGNSQSNASSQLDGSLRITHEAMQVKFRGADFNGWHTAYAFDVIRGLKNATSDSSPNRASFLASAASFRTELATLDRELRSPAEGAATAAVKRAFAQFMATDNQVIALYRQGTPAALRAANALVLGREITLFNQVSTNSDKLVALAQARAVKASAAARGAASSSRMEMIVVGLLTALLAVGLALVIARSIGGPLSELVRVGEQGRGFAVVAEEVRKLAEESQEAASEISELIGSMQRETTNAVAVVEDGARRTHDGVAVVEQTREAFLTIGQAVDNMVARVEQIAATSEEIAASAHSMQEGIVEAANVAEQSSASTEEVSASTEQTSASTEQIAASARELAGNAEQLNQLVQRFKIA